ncbi:hypothetical protein F5141DRAFT_1069076 [Pisolithus sp. B1]|nr:hypothetical protein F5141DRAFT_1069076 [Pisolithus sp. B1]
MAHYLIISGIPDSILMLIMHLETPHETFAYLKNRYGRIPRLEIQKVVDEAIQQHDMPYEQCEAENGNNELENSHGGEEDSLHIPSDSTETTNGCTKPEVEDVFDKVILKKYRTFIINYTTKHDDFEYNMH